MRRSSRYLKIIFFLALLLRIALIFRSNDLFYSSPFIEDAYYSFSVARAIGHGNGFSVDGTHLTNGVQPLIVLLYAPFFSLCTDEIALRFCFIIDAIIEFSLAYLCLLFVRICSRTLQKDKRELWSAGVFACSILLFSFSSSVYTLNGLETGLSSAFVILNFILYRRWFIDTQEEASILHIAAYGFLSGLMVLARIDTAFFIPVIGAHYLLSARKSGRLFHRIKQVTLIGIASLAVSAPWWIYNMANFGSFIPTSGISQSLRVPVFENITSFVQLLLNTILVIGYIPYTPELNKFHAAIILGSGIFILSVFLFRNLRRFMSALYRSIRVHWNMQPFFIMLAYAGILATYYLFFFGAPHFLQRYLFTLHVTVVCFVSVILSEVFLALRQKSKRSHQAAIIAFFAVLIGVYAIPYSWNFHSGIARQQNDFYRVSGWISAHTQSSDPVGMGQSGTAGFFNSNVTNLDGKVNYEVLNALRTNAFCPYVRSKQFEFLIDWKKFFIDLSYCNILSGYRCIDSVGRFYIYKRTQYSAFAPP